MNGVKSGQEKNTPWQRVPIEKQSYPVKTALQRVARWSDAYSAAVLVGDREGMDKASQLLDSAINDATERMGVESTLRKPPRTDSAVKGHTRESLTELSTEKILQLKNAGLHNDPLADIVLGAELERRGLPSPGKAVDELVDGLPFTGRRPTGIPAGDVRKAKPWKGRGNYLHPGENGYPASYLEILRTRESGATACDMNVPRTANPHKVTASSEANRERQAFLADVWLTGWKRRRASILHAQVECEKNAALWEGVNDSGSP